jgi:hypothetical protein
MGGNQAKEFITIICPELEKVLIGTYDSNIYENVEDYLVVLGEELDIDLSENNCQWMVTMEKVDIQVV